MTMNLIESKDKTIRQLQERNEFLEKLQAELSEEIRLTARKPDAKAALKEEKEARLDDVRNLKSASS
jgi:hypothetical protein